MNQVAKEFIVYSLKEISLLKNVKIPSYPKIILTQDDNKTETLAHFNPNNSEIVVYSKGRIYADIFRSIVHELVHYVQMLNNELTFNSGDTGTDIENEANSIAGIVLRNYTKLHPEIIKQSYPEIESKMEIPTLQGMVEVNLPIENLLNICKSTLNQDSYDGCLMLKLDIPNWEILLQQIDENDLYIDSESEHIQGLEREPHSTVLYGLSNKIDKQKLITSIKSIQNEIKVNLTEVNLFENEKFDVVKFKVDSLVMHKLHSFVKENFNNNESYPTYEPHVTIAYVKKGCGSKYVKQLDQPLTYSSKTFKYSGDNDSIEFNVSSYLNKPIVLKEYSQGVINRLTKQYKTEFPNLTDEQILYYINRFDQLKSSPKVVEKDILKYKSFRDLEQVVDAFPTKEKVKKDDLNNVEFSNTELIYNSSPLQIYHGDSPKSCIKIKGDFPATWCIARSGGGNMYHNYRFRDNEPSFYFVKNLERMNKITGLEDDKYCFFVIQIDINGDYIVTSALNDGDEELTWDEVVEIEPLLNVKEKLFKHNPLQANEKELYSRFKGGVDIEEYKKLSHPEKKQYLAIRNELDDEEFLNSPDDIKNDYITMGATLTGKQFDLIKDDKQLLSNYKRVLNNSKLLEYVEDDLSLDSREIDLVDVDKLIPMLLSDRTLQALESLNEHLYDGNFTKTDKPQDFYDRDLIKGLWKRHLFYYDDNLSILQKIVDKYPSLNISFKAFGAGFENSSYVKFMQIFENCVWVYYTAQTHRIQDLIYDDIRDNEPNPLTEDYVSNIKAMFRIGYLPRRFHDYIKSHLTDLENASIDVWEYRKNSSNSNLAIFLVSLNENEKQTFIKKVDKKSTNEVYQNFVSNENLNECDCEDDEIESLIEYLKTVKDFINEAEYQGRKITLNKPMRGDVKKFKVYVKNSKGNVIKVNFGSKDYNIKKNNPNRKKSYCSRSKGIEGGGTDKTKANYWSRKMWKCN